MGSEQEKKPHAVCIPNPAQGHINPMLKHAKILHNKGFLITFVNKEFNHQRLVRSQRSDTLSSFSSFRFVTIPDGLPPPDNKDATHDVNIVLKSLHETGFTPFKSLVSKTTFGRPTSKTGPQWWRRTQGQRPDRSTNTTVTSLREEDRDSLLSDII
nr:7-deoxyloganetin glucosyltransferase-like [Tanacetum cinerariifolium]